MRRFHIIGAPGWANVYQVVCNGTTQYLDTVPAAAFQSANAWTLSGWWTGNATAAASRIVAIVLNKTGALKTYVYLAQDSSLTWAWGAGIDGVSQFVAAFAPPAGFSPSALAGTKRCHVLSYSAGTLTWSIDGTSIRQRAVTLPMSALFGATTPASHLSACGYSSNGAPGGWLGADLDQLATWTAAKTYADVSAGGLPTSLAGKAGLADWWDWDNLGDTGNSATNRQGGNAITGYNSPTLEAV
jgi:hypothetical protein